jgi:hypothetical protein
MWGIIKKIKVYKSPPRMTLREVLAKGTRLLFVRRLGFLAEEVT